MNASKSQLTEVTVLRKIRDELGISQEVLAREIGCSVNTVRRAEYGDTEPKFSAEQWINFQRLLKSHKIKLPIRLSEKLPA